MEWCSEWIHLNEFALTKVVMGQTPFDSILYVARLMGCQHLDRLL
jgi:hypothetical protein